MNSSDQTLSGQYLTPTNLHDTFLVGVGASAGGLNAIYELFDEPSPLNTTFIVIQHLPPDYKSNTASLLATHTKREIKEIADNMLIEPDSIYVMTERKNITIKKGRLHTSNDDGAHPSNSVDVLFKSLAEFKGPRSGAIILSGANADGTIGAKSIKEAGGFVIAQDPSTAEFNVMPASVINAGLSDAVAVPKLLMSELEKQIKQSALVNQFSDDNEAALQEILELIASNTSLDFSDYKSTTIVRRITRRMNHYNFKSISDYIAYLKDNLEEIEVLSREFMIRVTRFFRDQQAFELIREKVIPEIIENKLDDGNLKIWTVGCASGEEAYSLAILIAEHLEEIKNKLTVKIFATDIDQKALAIASKGIYRNSIEEDISEERLSKYFYKENNQYRIKENIRSMLIFAPHDITKHPPYYKLDFISCRNVIIYFNTDLQKKILSTLHYCLNLGGYLFLGPSESIGELKTRMWELDKKWKIYKNVEEGKIPDYGKYSTPQYFSNQGNITNVPLKSVKFENRKNISDRISDIVLNEFGSAGVSIDADFKITQTFGDIDKYLLQERFNFNLLEMLPKELSIAIGASLRKFLTEQTNKEIKGIVFEDKGELRSVNVLIKSISSAEKTILVIFSENKTDESPIRNTEVFQDKVHFNRYISDLEEELKDMREKLKEADEELELSNTNAQVFNEELISSNEELQSTNEEVQSVNEELQTVNNQYQLKIKELAELNDDLNNYFRSAQNAQIYIDKNLIIKKFTPAAIKQINIKDTDIGRPITDISTNIKFSTLIEDIKMAIDSHEISEKEIQTRDKRWYQMMFMPYLRQQDNKIDGIVITFNDITDLKKSQMALMRINEDHNLFIYSVSHDLNSPISNIEGIINALNKTLNDNNNDDEVITYLGLLKESVKKLKDTVVELADVIKVEKESTEEVQEPVNINDLFKEIDFSIHDIILKSNAKINLDINQPLIRFSKKNLRSILINLITNAIKYKSSDRPLEINIRTKKSGNYINLIVEDNGLGINDEKKREIFTKFERAHETSGIEGTGIGLYLVKRIVTNAGGKIKVESEVGKGSTFIVSFKDLI